MLPTAAQSWRAPFFERRIGYCVLLLLTAVSPAAAMDPAFAVVSGSCVADSGSCVKTPNFPDSYVLNEDCTVNITAAGFVTAATFDTVRCE